MKISSGMEARVKWGLLKEESINSGKGKIFYMCMRCFLQRGKSAFLFVRVKPYEFFSLPCRIIKRAPINNDKSKLSSLEGVFFLCMDHQDGTFQAQFLSSCRGWNWNCFSQLQSCRWDIRLSLYGLKEAAWHWAWYGFFSSKLKSTPFLRATERTWSSFAVCYQGITDSCHLQRDSLKLLWKNLFTAWRK